MSNTTHNLPYKRFVAQVSTGVPRSKSTWLSLMAENLEALKACPWREAADVEVALTPHDFTLSSYFSDVYDAFKMTGNYDSSVMTEIGYAGMAAYRFKVPDDATTRSIALSSIALPISRDRFLLGGVRIAAVLSADEEPSTKWSVVRGDGDGALVEKDVLKQTAANLLAGSPGAETVEIDLSGLSSGNPAAYLWVYVTIEDYTDRWQMYNASEQRLYAIEGSSMLVGDSAVTTFAAAVAADDAPAVLAVGGSSPTWLEPLPTVNVGTTPPSVPAGDPLVEPFFTPQQSRVDAVEGQIQRSFSTPSWTGTATLHYTGQVITKITLDYQSADGSASASGYLFQSTTVNGQKVYYRFSSHTTTNGAGQTVYLGVEIGGISISNYGTDGMTSRFEFWIVAGDTQQNGLNNQGGLTVTGTLYRSTPTYIKQTAAVTLYYLLLVFSNGVPTDADTCAAPSEDSRQHSSVLIEGSASPWTVTIAGTAYTVTKIGSAVTMKQGATTLGTWTSNYTGEPEFFDASVALYLPGEDANDAVAAYGLAATAGDFSHAVATYEHGAQPSNAELLGRLARMSRETSGGMAYLHPAGGALADELDVLRPVPRFFRASSAPDDQTSCQPGLSVWYWRPDESAVAAGLAYRGAVVSVGVVSDPAFLQLALLALRSPRAFARRITLTNGSSATSNGFVLRFVAWKSPAAQWDRSNSFALAAMASMPSVYRSDGPSSVSWQVDCSGSLLPLDSRVLQAERIGVSQAVVGQIAASAAIEIPIVAPVGEGDVVIIAPEVLGFADGTGAASVAFARQADPAETTPAEEGQPENAANHKHAWARYTENLGWFPAVTGE